MNKLQDTRTDIFDSIRLTLASPEHILSWSYGEITKPETLNYRTQKPEKDGLFDERIFGPTKDWECYCGKYKKVRYKGVICDKCGVEVTRSIVRRERMGHIKLATPCVHFWFMKTPSIIGLILNISSRDLEKVVYFANYIITEVDDEDKKKFLMSQEKELQNQKEALEKEKKTKLKEIGQHKSNPEVYEKQKKFLEKEFTLKIEDLEKELRIIREDLDGLVQGKVISEIKYQNLFPKYSNLFKAEMGGKAVYKLLARLDLKKLAHNLRKEEENSTGQKKRRALRRLKLVEGLEKANLRPEWTVFTVLPVIPPDLRPMVQLDGGRFAASDLNDLYRRIINRNNRLKRLLDIGAPEVIARNEKRMLQEAVNALIDISAYKEKIVTTKKKPRSLTCMLKGKTGRFRQNLLGKRVDYSGRSVIVVGPQLKLHQCGIPKMMALELFKPFVVGTLIREGIVHNIKSAGRMIERGKTEVWDALEKVIKDKYVLLNRAPTLHRLGIQGFQPILIEGKAIQIHPLVCAAFNADFDGDQMAVHVPLSSLSQKETREIMLSTYNLLKPASGEPIVQPDQDMVFGCYWLTLVKKNLQGEGKFFSSFEEALYAYQMEYIKLQTKIKVKIPASLAGRNKEILETTVGRIIFNQTLPSGISFMNETMNNKKLKALVGEIFAKFGREENVRFIDEVKNLGFKFATNSGISISFNDLEIPTQKEQAIKKGEEKIIEIIDQYQNGLITDEERYLKTVELWEGIKAEIQKEIEEKTDPFVSMGLMVASGSRGDMSQVMQLSGMKGLVVSPTGKIIEVPITSNYKEGLRALEYFISTHGARKGLSDTALKTSDSGYLTRRLIDVAQDVFVTKDDCGSTEGILVQKTEDMSFEEDFVPRILGRVTAENIYSSRDKKKILISKGQLISKEDINLIQNENIKEVYIRSLLNCKTVWGVCQKCYGLDLGKGELVQQGEAVGVIAAQSIGEPGTQLTMRTFHTGGIVGVDITQGLPRVEELFEARMPKGEAVLAEFEGVINVTELNNKKIIKITKLESQKDEYLIPQGYKLAVKENQKITIKEVLATSATKKPIKAQSGGRVKISGKMIIIVRPRESKDYEVSPNMVLKVTSGQRVSVGESLTEGSINLQKAFKLLGREFVQRYIISEVQQIYALQGQTINNKHIEIIVRQMFSRLRIEDSGGTPFIKGEIVSRGKFMEVNNLIKEKKDASAKAETLILPITRVALTTDSFLSAASFQETTRVLINASIKGEIDHLNGLKENVIIGRLIPVGTGFKG